MIVIGREGESLVTQKIEVQENWQKETNKGEKDSLTTGGCVTGVDTTVDTARVVEDVVLDNASEPRLLGRSDNV